MEISRRLSHNKLAEVKLLHAWYILNRYIVLVTLSSDCYILIFLERKGI